MSCITVVLDKILVSVKQTWKITGHHYWHVSSENILPEGISLCSLDPQL